MTVYRFRAVTTLDRPETGVLEATSVADAQRQLMNRGLYPLHVAQRGTGINALLSTQIGRRSLVLVETGQLLADLGHLVEAGVEVAAALEIMASAGAKPRVLRILEALNAQVRQGRSLSEALAASDAKFPSHVIAVVRAGEISGQLAEGLIRVSNTIHRTATLRSQIRTALIYPACVAAAATIAILVLLGVVVPALETIFAGATNRLPWQTQALVALGHFVRDYAWLIGLGWAGLLLGFAATYRNKAARVKIEHAMLGVPVVGNILIAAETARIAALLSMLASAGLPLANAVAISSDAARMLVSQIGLKAAVVKLREGAHIHDALAGVPTIGKRPLALIRIGELTGRLSQLLEEAARDSEYRVSAAVDRLLALLTPVMTLAFGAVAGFVLYTVMTSILAVNDLAIKPF